MPNRHISIIHYSSITCESARCIHQRARLTDVRSRPDICSLIRDESSRFTPLRHQIETLGLVQPYRLQRLATNETKKRPRLGMSRPTLEELIRLPEDAAVQAYFDGENTAILRRMMVILAAGAVVGVIGFLGSSHYLRAGLWFLGLLAILAVFLSRTTRFYLRNAREIGRASCRERVCLVV